MGSIKQPKQLSSDTEQVPPKGKPPIQKLTRAYRDLVFPNMKNIVIFSESMVKRLKINIFNLQICGDKVYLKLSLVQKQTNLLFVCVMQQLFIME